MSFSYCSLLVKKQNNEFCCPVTLRCNLLVTIYVFLLFIFWTFKYIISHLSVEKQIMLLLPAHLNAFHFFSCLLGLITLTRMSRTMSTLSDK